MNSSECDASKDQLTCSAVANLELLCLNPEFHQKIWGGRHLKTEFNYAIPDGRIGECWAISAHPHGDCKLSAGPLAGNTLSQVWDSHPELFGNIDSDRFPLLIKILDAEDDLSIQVHPDDAYARTHEHNSLGKSECWYVLHAKPDATIIVGQKAHSREEFAQLVKQGAWKEVLNEVPIHEGDFFQIDPGCVHAIKAGTMVLETQQSSDITYRVYDYDRRQKDGSLRELHMEKSLDVINYHAPLLSSGAVHAPEHDGVTTLCVCPRYTILRIRVHGARTLAQSAPFLCVSVVEGEGSIAGLSVKRGSHVIVTALCSTLQLEGDMTLIASHI